MDSPRRCCRGWISAAAARQLATLVYVLTTYTQQLISTLSTRPRSLPQVDPGVANDGGGSGAANDLAARLCKALEACVRVVHVAVAPHEAKPVVKQQRVHLVESSGESVRASDARWRLVVALTARQGRSILLPVCAPGDVVVLVLHVRKAAHGKIKLAGVEIPGGAREDAAAVGPGTRKAADAPCDVQRDLPARVKVVLGARRQHDARPCLFQSGVNRIYVTQCTNAIFVRPRISAQTKNLTALYGMKA